MGILGRFFGIVARCNWLHMRTLMNRLMNAAALERSGSEMSFNEFFNESEGSSLKWRQQTLKILKWVSSFVSLWVERKLTGWRPIQHVATSARVASSTWISNFELYPSENQISRIDSLISRPQLAYDQGTNSFSIHKTLPHFNLIEFHLQESQVILIQCQRILSRSVQNNPEKLYKKNLKNSQKIL